MTDGLIDLSHTIKHGMITYKGLPGPEISNFMDFEASRSHYGEDTCFHIGRITMVANTGTYLDSPFHRYPTGQDLSQLALSSLADLEGQVFSTKDQSIGPELFGDAPLAGKAVLIHTGWDKHWGEDTYFEGHPYLTAEAAQKLVSAGVRLVGIDSLNIDDTRDGKRSVHTICLAAGIPVVEHLCNLEMLPHTGFRFFAVPAKVAGMGTFPVRAFAITK